MSISTKLFALALAGLAAAPAPTAPPELGSERIESIALEASGRGGMVTTRSVALDGGVHRYAFGSGACRAHKVEGVLLEQMFAALRARQPVHVGATIAHGDDNTQCLERVVFFAPD